MAWNEPGNGRRNPWGDGSGGGGGNNGQPPDLEEMLRQLKRRFAAIFGGKPGGAGRAGGESSGAGGLGLIIVALLVIWALVDSFHIIDQRERGVVLRFGKADRILEPGPRFTLPRPIESLERVDVTQVRSMSNKVAMLTRDENLVNIDFAVQYTVSDATLFLFKVRDVEDTLAQVAEAAVRQVVGSRSLDDVQVGNRLEFTNEAREIMQRLLNNYKSGINVSIINFQDVMVPEQVKDAFDDAIKAREDKQRAINDALAYAADVVPKASGRKARILAEAEGYKQSAVARANGDAERFTLLVEQYRAAPEVTRKRLYLETMQEVLSRTPKVLIDGDKGNNMLYLPLDKLAVPPTPAERAAPSMSGGEGR
jgi:membrane protease subunit HflK